MKVKTTKVRLGLKINRTAVPELIAIKAKMPDHAYGYVVFNIPAKTSRPDRRKPNG
jgi:hypothetical protein